MGLLKFFRYPFGVSGDKAEIPDKMQPSGAVSYEAGFGFDYERDPATDANAKDVPRQETNQIFHDVTASLRQFQAFGLFPYIVPEQNGGAPFPYGKAAQCLYDAGKGAEAYESLVDNNTSLPTDKVKWRRITDLPFVPTARKVNTTAPITGGGALSGDLTLGVTFGSAVNTVCQGNDPRLSNARTPAAHAATHKTGGTDALSAADVGAVPTARKVNTTAPITGGGALSGDLTLGVTFGSAVNTVCQGNDPRLSNARTPAAHAATHKTGGTDALTAADVGAVPTARKINTQVPLTGGGVLSGDITLGASAVTAATATADSTVGGWVKLAADNAAESVRNMAATPAGVAAQIKRAPAALRAWAFVNANGSIARSYNVAGVVKKGAGRYEITLAAAAPDTSYLIFPIPMGDSEMAWMDRGTTATTTKFQLVTANSAGLAFDARFAFNIVY